MGDSISWIKDLKKHHIFNAALLFLALVSPGFIGLYVLDANLFIALDTIKLLFLSISMSLPAFTFAFIVIVTHVDPKNKKADPPYNLLTATIYSSLNVFLVAGLSIGLRKAFITPVWVLVLGSFVILALLGKAAAGHMTSFMDGQNKDKHNQLDSTSTQSK